MKSKRRDMAGKSRWYATGWFLGDSEASKRASGIHSSLHPKTASSKHLLRQQQRTPSSAICHCTCKHKWSVEPWPPWPPWHAKPSHTRCRNVNITVCARLRVIRQRTQCKRGDQGISRTGRKKAPPATIKMCMGVWAV